MDFLTIASAFLLALTLLLRHLSKRDSRLPPGPIWLPLIGNLHLLGHQPHHSLAKLAKKHGPIMSLKLGQVTTIVISSSDVIKEIIQNHDLAFSSRTVPNCLHAHDEHKYSVVWLPVAGSRWRSLRKILVTNIFSVKRLDDSQYLRSNKVEELIAYCRKNSENGEAVDIGRAVFRTTLNLLSNIIFSKDVTDPFLDDSVAKEFKDLMYSIMIEAGKPDLVDFFPFLTKIDPQGRRRRMTVHFGKILHIIRGLIDERLRSRQVFNDVLDVLLATAKESSQEIDRNHIEHMCLDLFVAGTETQSSALEWAMAEMLKNPDKLKKTQDEMALVIGKGKVIQDADVAHLPYLRCVVQETLRMHSPAALIVRRTEQQVEVCGYNIPKDSLVIFNAWAIGRDETIWKDGSTFKPERFLESNTDVVRGHDFEMIPFGNGRRICPGMPLAIRMAHIMLGSLLNCFDWELENGIAPKALDMEEKIGFTMQKTRPLRAVPIRMQI